MEKIKFFERYYFEKNCLRVYVPSSTAWVVWIHLYEGEQYTCDIVTPDDFRLSPTDRACRRPTIVKGQSEAYASEPPHLKIKRDLKISLLNITHA